MSGLKVELKTLSDEVSAAGRNLDVASAEIKTLNESIEATALETVGLTKAIGENTTKSSKLSVNIRDGRFLFESSGVIHFTAGNRRFLCILLLNVIFLLQYS